MAVKKVSSIASVGDLYTEIAGFLVDPSVGFTSVGSVTHETVLFDVFRQKNTNNSAGLTDEEYAYVMLSQQGGQITLGTARAFDGVSTLTGAIAVANMPVLSGFTFPLQLLVVATKNRVGIGFLDPTDSFSAIYWAQVNYGSLDADAIAAVPGHLFNMQNNLHCVGTVGGSARLLYAGHGYPTEQTAFDQAATLISLIDDSTDKRSQPSNVLLVSSVAVKNEGDEFYGILDGVYFTKSSVPHIFDRFTYGVSNHRFIKDQASSFGAIFREEA